MHGSKNVKFCTSSSQGVRYMHNMSQDRIESGFEPFRSRCTKAFLTGPLCPINCCPSHGSPVPVIKVQIDPRLRLLTSSGSNKKEPK